MNLAFTFPTGRAVLFAFSAGIVVSNDYLGFIISPTNASQYFFREGANRLIPEGFDGGIGIILPEKSGVGGIADSFCDCRV